jgi:hypothetical protein
MKAQARRLARNSFAPAIRNSLAFTPEVVPTLNRLRIVSNGIGDWYHRLPRIQNARAHKRRTPSTLLHHNQAARGVPNSSTPGAGAAKISASAGLALPT